jgi:molybdate/tungstate transport system ATP-binding protein
LIEGELAQTGQKSEIFEKPLNLKVAGFVGMQNILKGVIASNTEGIVNIDVSGKLIEAVSDYQARESVSVCIRPEDIALSFDRPSGSVRNVFEGEITEVVEFGVFVRMGPLEGLVHLSQIANDFLSYDKNVPAFVGKQTKKALRRAT